MKRFLIAEKAEELGVKPLTKEEDGIRVGFFRDSNGVEMGSICMVTKGVNQKPEAKAEAKTAEASQIQNDRREELDGFKELSSLSANFLSSNADKLLYLKLDIICDCIYNLDYWNSLGKTRVLSQKMVDKDKVIHIQQNKKQMPIKPLLLVEKNVIQDFCANQILPFFDVSNPPKLYGRPYRPIAAIDLLPEKIDSIFDLYIHETVTSAQLCLSICKNLLNYAESNPESYDDVENIIMKNFQQIAKAPYRFGTILMVEEIFNVLNNRQFPEINNLSPFRSPKENMLQGDNLERCIEEIIDTSTNELYMENRKSMLEHVVAEYKIFDERGNIDSLNMDKARKYLYDNLTALVVKPSPFHYHEVIILNHKLNGYKTETAKNYKLFKELQHRICAKPTAEANEEPQ